MEGELKTPEGRLGPYTLLERIGRGGMAELFLARISRLEDVERLVAIKLVLPQLADDPTFAEMFLREARIASNLHHPSIAQVFDVGKVGGRYFMAMEYVHGRDLRKVLRAGAQSRQLMPLGTAIGIGASVCAAAHYAHECTDPSGRHLEIVHRDISPSNVLIRFDGVVKVVDFGIAKAAQAPEVTESGTIKGKRGYMSPEQCNGTAVDRRSDIFALGILLYELTTGYRVFAGANDLAVMNRIVKGDYTPPRRAVPDYPAALGRVIERALNVDPQQRYVTAAELQRDLEEFAREAKLDTSALTLEAYVQGLFGEEPYPVATSWGTLEATETSTPAPTRRRWPAAAGIAVAMGVAGGAVWILRADDDRLPQPGSDPASVEQAPPPVAKAPVPEASPRPQPAPTEPAASEKRSLGRKKGRKSKRKKPRKRNTLFPE